MHQTLREITDLIGVRLIRDEHDPLRLAQSTSDLSVWDGQQLRGLVWEQVPPPEGGDTVSMGWHGLRAPNFGEKPTHVNVPCTVWGDYCGDVMNRANFEALIEDYPDTFIQVGYAERDGMFLAVPLDQPLDEHLLSGLLRMRDDYPLWSEEKLAEVEWHLTDEAWDAYLHMDLPRDLERAGVDDRVADELDTDATGPGSLRAAFYDLTGEMPEFPHGEANCGTSIVFPYYQDTVDLLAERLGRITEHTWTVRDGLADAFPWLRLPALTVPSA